MTAPRDDCQISQRLRVGLIGLVAVVLLIGLAGWIIGSTAREQPVNGTAEIAINLAADNASAEPLAELGATPGTVNDQVAAER